MSHFNSVSGCFKVNYFAQCKRGLKVIQTRDTKVSPCRCRWYMYIDTAQHWDLVLVNILIVFIIKLPQMIYIYLYISDKSHRYYVMQLLGKLWRLNKWKCQDVRTWNCWPLHHYNKGKLIVSVPSKEKILSCKF